MAVSNVTPHPSRGDALIRRALVELEKRLRDPGPQLSSPDTVTSYLRLSLGPSDVERMFVLYLDAQNRLLAAEEASRGTVTTTHVHSREIVRKALQLNAVGVILAHNHPSGSPDPSEADWDLTRVVKTTLRLVDVTVLDHVIVAGRDAVSMRGLKQWTKEFPSELPLRLGCHAATEPLIAEDSSRRSKDEKEFLRLVKSVPPEARRYVLLACQAVVDEALRKRSRKPRSGAVRKKAKA
jgi:hypothetical protein